MKASNFLKIGNLCFEYYKIILNACEKKWLQKHVEDEELIYFWLEKV